MGSFRGGNPLFVLGEIYVVILIIRAVLSWFPYNPNSPFSGVRRVIHVVTEPVLGLFRRIIPPVGMIDISFLVAIIVIELIVFNVLARLPV